MSLLKRFLFLFGIVCLISHAARAEHVVSPEAHIDLNTSKVMHIIGEIEPNMLYKIATEQLLTIGIPGDRLVMISSPGGRVDVGSMIMNMLEMEQKMGTRLVCVVLGDASSMAFNILTHCDVRLSITHSHFLVHKVAMGGLEGDSERLTSITLRKYAAKLDEVDQPFRLANAKAMHLSQVDYDYFAENERIWDEQTLLIKRYLHGIAHIEQ